MQRYKNIDKFSWKGENKRMLFSKSSPSRDHGGEVTNQAFFEFGEVWIKHRIREVDDDLFDSDIYQAALQGHIQEQDLSVRELAEIVNQLRTITLREKAYLRIVVLFHGILHPIGMCPAHASDHIAFQKDRCAHLKNTLQIIHEALLEKLGLD